LEIPRGNFGSFGQFILCETFAHPLPAHIGTEDLDSLPFFFGQSHDTLHRFLMLKMNDTYIVKTFLILLAKGGGFLKCQFGASPGSKYFRQNKQLDLY
jgi:hypothetical protein